jgi:hypothetical protein
VAVAISPFSASFSQVVGGGTSSSWGLASEMFSSVLGVGRPYTNSHFSETQPLRGKGSVQAQSCAQPWLPSVALPLTTL